MNSIILVLVVIEVNVFVIILVCFLWVILLYIRVIEFMLWCYIYFYCGEFVIDNCVLNIILFNSCDDEIN